MKDKKKNMETGKGNFLSLSILIPSPLPRF